MHYLVLLCDANDPTGGPGAGIACGLAELVAALAEVVLVGVDHDGAADDGVLAHQRDHPVRDVHLGRPVRRGHVAEVAHVPRALLVLGRSVGTAVRVEVRPGAGAAVSVVAKLEMQIIDTRFINVQ